jgi:uncharacterized membrane protein YvbJ
MYCEKCGSRLKEGDKFCTNCGNKILPINNVSKVEQSIKTKESVDTKSDGGAVISFVLAVICEIIPIIVSLMMILQLYLTTTLSIILTIVLLVISMIGLIVGINSKTKTGIRLAGIIMNAFCLARLIIDLVISLIIKFS